MKTRLTSVLSIPVALFLSASAFAAPSDDLAAAAKKLADAPTYGWTTTTQMGDNSFPVDGVTEKGGYTIITRSFNGNTSQTIRKGTEVVMQNRDGDWMNNEDMRAQFAQRGGGGGQGGGGQGGQRGGGQGGGGGRGGFGGGFGGGMFGGGGAAIPAEALANYAAKLKDLKEADGALVATAKDDDAAALMAPAGGHGGRGGRGGQGGGGGGAAPADDQGKRGGRGGFGVKYTSVELKFWLKDGTVSKYSVHSIGTFSRNGEDTTVDNTSTTEIKDVGTAKVEVPDAAKKKFTQ